MEKILGTISSILVAILIVLTLFGSVYQVDEQSQAVLTTFGKVSSIEDAGLHFKIPFIQRVRYVPINMTQSITIGYEHDKDGNVITNDSESRIMTGDDNILLVDFFIEWKISDPVDYLYNSNNPEDILKVLAQSSARNIIGSELVDEVLTTGKDRIQNEIEDKIRENLEDYDIGIQIIDVKIQDVEPPTSSVVQAFKAVEDAKLYKETLITEANTYGEQNIPDAESKADKLTKDADAYYESKIKLASGEADRFNSIYEEYSKYPDVTRTRMYLEVIEKLFPNMKIYVNTTNGGTNTMLPLESFATSQSN